jgi:hypothetical protein
MRCYPNYNPNPLIPTNRVTNRFIYDEFPFQIPQDQIKLSALKSPNSDNISKNRKYAYLINNPKKIYGTQTDIYTNPNTVGVPRVGTTLISINNNPTCSNEYPIDNPSLFPSNQTSVVYPTHPIPPTSIPCINYTALAGGTLLAPSCFEIEN